MRERIADLGDGVDVALVTFARTEELAAYQRRADLPFPMLVDADRSVYRAYGLGRGSLREVWGWATIRRYAEILRSSGPGRLRPWTADSRQLGGDFVIAPDGTLAWGFWGTGPADRPTVDTLIAAVRRTS